MKREDFPIALSLLLLHCRQHRFDLLEGRELGKLQLRLTILFYVSFLDAHEAYSGKFLPKSILEKHNVLLLFALRHLGAERRHKVSLGLWGRMES